MWTPCPVVLDAPVTVLGLDLYDLAALGVIPIFLRFFCDIFMSFGVALGLGIALYLAQRGRPSGFVLHWLHGMELIKLPGVLSPRTKRYSLW